MSRLVSFLVLVAIVIVTGVVFFRVMAGFLLPMFLAALLVVMFRPLHAWIAARCQGRERLAAGLTTIAILLIVLLPMAAVLIQATIEVVFLANNVNISEVGERLENLTAQVKERAPPEAARWIDENATSEKIASSLEQVKEQIGPLVLGGTQAVGGVLGSLLVGAGVMIVSLYYFLADGPGMIKTIMRLSPLDDKYERQLLDEFDSLSRAVVVAMLASALAQGALAMPAYYVLGFKSVFFLTILTMLFALIPFVGAAAVWVPCALWLLAIENSLGKAIGLAVYGVAVISMADNLIKPWVLRGRSNLHPLLGLLSVLGGVRAMGPIGILVGPMVVAFLQTLLNMLHAEINAPPVPPASASPNAQAAAVGPIATVATQPPGTA